MLLNLYSYHTWSHWTPNETRTSRDKLLLISNATAHFFFCWVWKVRGGGKNEPFPPHQSLRNAKENTLKWRKRCCKRHFNLVFWSIIKAPLICCSLSHAWSINRCCYQLSQPILLDLRKITTFRLQSMLSACWVSEVNGFIFTRPRLCHTRCWRVRTHTTGLSSHITPVRWSVALNSFVNSSDGFPLGWKERCAPVHLFWCLKWILESHDFKSERVEWVFVFWQECWKSFEHSQCSKQSLFWDKWVHLSSPPYVQFWLMKRHS